MQFKIAMKVGGGKKRWRGERSSINCHVSSFLFALQRLEMKIIACVCESRNTQFRDGSENPESEGNSEIAEAQRSKITPYKQKLRALSTSPKFRRT